MTKPHLTHGLLAAAGALALAGPAAAQYTPPGYGYPNYGAPGVGAYGAGVARSPLSPYLNITAGVNNPAVNYYNFTRPALQAQAALQQQNQSLPPLGEPFGVASQDVSLLPALDPTNKLPRPTGHPSAFQYYGG